MSFPDERIAPRGLGYLFGLPEGYLDPCRECIGSPWGRQLKLAIYPTINPTIGPERDCTQGNRGRGAACIFTTVGPASRSALGDAAPYTELCERDFAPVEQKPMCVAAPAAPRTGVTKSSTE